jgi:hypothetical protein
MFAVGDVVEIFAPQAGHKKYHVCICVNVGAVHQFLYLNSDPGFDDTLAFDCETIPCLPVSKTGKTVFTFAILPRYNDKQLKLFAAKKLGELGLDVAKEVLAFIATVRTLNTADRKLVTEGLNTIIANLTAANSPSTDAIPGE